MKKYSHFLNWVVVLFTLSCTSISGNQQTSSSSKSSSPPNIIYILADDLGYGELGSYGQKKIRTPHLDALANGGMRFTQHYSGAPVCAPARCVLLTGLHTGHAHIRGNDEWRERGEVWDYQAMFDNPFLEGQRPLPDSTITIAEQLVSAGYATGMVGKWGLGAPTTEGVPNRQGFDFFYGYNCQRQAHTLFPMHLWRNEERHILNNANVPPHANLEEGANPNDPASYARFQLNDYAPELMHKEALQFIDRHKNQPFFLYYASPIPHVPLQAPQHWVDHYRELFGEEEPFTGTSYFPNQTPRATYAAMISYLDEQVGELVQQLKDLGLYENTLIIFSSDNGPTYTGGADTPWFDSAAPFKSERGWAKGFVHEGGIRVPMIASWPDRIQAGSESDLLSAFYDVMPTFCEIAGVEPPSHTDGVSFLPTLIGEPQVQSHEFLYWEFPAYKGQQAIRMGKWKAIRRHMMEGNLEIELYDLDADIQEQNNVAQAYPNVIARMEEILDQEHQAADLDRFRFEVFGEK
ncbi:MAG: arylsulfatase [Bacteroidota bacterium]